MTATALAEALRHPRRRPRCQSSPRAGAAMAAESASGIPLDLVALVTPVPADGGQVPGEIIEHQAHAVGHAAVLLADRGVLLAGDMLSDVLIPLFDFRQDVQVGASGAACGLALRSPPVEPGAGPRSVGLGRRVLRRSCRVRQARATTTLKTLSSRIVPSAWVPVAIASRTAAVVASRPAVLMAMRAGPDDSWPLVAMSRSG